MVLIEGQSVVKNEINAINEVLNCVVFFSLNSFLSNIVRSRKMALSETKAHENVLYAGRPFDQFVIKRPFLF